MAAKGMPAWYRRWRQSWDGRLHQPRIRYAAWVDALLMDHGLLRPLWNRPQQFAKDAWRSHQPAPGQLRRLSQLGLKTVINLRGGGSSGSILLAAGASQRLGMTVVDFRMSSRGAPSVERVVAFAELIDNIETPVLLHCKSGADRSGFAAGLYLLITGQGSVSDAKAQLTWRNLHFRGAKTGMLHQFFCVYEQYLNNEQHPVSFLDWVTDVYSPEQLEQSFQPRKVSAWLVDKVLRRE